MMCDMTEIEIEHQCYCPDNSVFCRYLDKASGLCIATTCKHAQELLMQVEVERQAKAAQEVKDGWLEIQNSLYEQALEQLERLGATTLELDISEEDLHDIERSWGDVQPAKGKTRKSTSKPVHSSSGS